MTVNEMKKLKLMIYQEFCQNMENWRTLNKKGESFNLSKLVFDHDKKVVKSRIGEH